jgi:hypothetical protein
MHEEISRGFFCSELSAESGEKMFGTAPRVDLWLLLEYRGHWDENALPSVRIPEDVRDHLFKSLASIPNSRIQLIKRHSYKNPDDPLRLYVVVSKELEPKLYEFSFFDYRDLLWFDIHKLISQDRYLRKSPVLLVCTHGTYDRCCGKFGIPVYLEALKNEIDYITWQCSHVGGHRFAPNLLCFPHGIYYGRVGKGEVINLISDYRSGVLNLEKYRGRCCFNPEVQAAEYFLRVNTGMVSISEIRFNKVSEVEKDTWLVEFFVEAEDRTYSVCVKKESGALFGYMSCGDKTRSPIVQYKLVDFKRL